MISALFANDDPYLPKTLGISRAFTQSDSYNKMDRVRIEMTKYVAPAYPTWEEELRLDSHCVALWDSPGSQTTRSEKDMARYGGPTSQSDIRQ